MGWCGHGWEPLLPGRGMWHHAHPKVETEEPLGTARMMEVLSLPLPPSSSHSSCAASFPLLSTHSWSRATPTLFFNFFKCLLFRSFCFHRRVWNISFTSAGRGNIKISVSNCCRASGVEMHDADG